MYSWSVGAFRCLSGRPHLHISSMRSQIVRCKAMECDMMTRKVKLLSVEPAYRRHIGASAHWSRVRPAAGRGLVAIVLMSETCVLCSRSVLYSSNMFNSVVTVWRRQTSNIFDGRMLTECKEVKSTPQTSFGRLGWVCHFWRPPNPPDIYTLSECQKLQMTCILRKEGIEACRIPYFHMHDSVILAFDPLTQTAKPQSVTTRSSSVL